MIDLLVQIWAFLRQVAGLFYSVYVFFHDGVVFAFRLIVAGIKLVAGVCTGGLAFLLPLALLSLTVGFALLLTGQR